MWGTMGRATAALLVEPFHTTHPASLMPAALGVRISVKQDKGSVWPTCWAGHCYHSSRRGIMGGSI